MGKGHSDVPAELQAELEALAEMSDDKIDTSDILESLDWSGAARGLLFVSAEERKEDLAKLISSRTVSYADELAVATSD